MWDCTIYVAKTKALISCAVTTQLTCAFVFAYAKSRFLIMRFKCFLCLDYNCPGCHTIYLSTIFIRFFRHRRLTAGYGVCVYILYGYHVISLMGFYNGPVQAVD